MSFRQRLMRHGSSDCTEQGPGKQSEQTGPAQRILPGEREADKKGTERDQKQGEKARIGTETRKEEVLAPEHDSACKRSSERDRGKLHAARLRRTRVSI